MILQVKQHPLLWGPHGDKKLVSGFTSCPRKTVYPRFKTLEGKRTSLRVENTKHDLTVKVYKISTVCWRYGTALTGREVEREGGGDCMLVGRKEKRDGEWENQKVNFLSFPPVLFPHSDAVSHPSPEDKPSIIRSLILRTSIAVQEEGLKLAELEFNNRLMLKRIINAMNAPATTDNHLNIQNRPFRWGRGRYTFLHKKKKVDVSVSVSPFITYLGVRLKIDY